ncbi:hypothetical protein HMI56_004635, partial [Coelomomyces lativittatus]
MTASDHLTLRALVGMKEAGIVIGKGGSNIKAIRDASNARVAVSEHVPGVPERVLSITGAVDEVAKAYAQVSRNLNQGDLRGNSPDAVESTPLTLRFLIPHSRMGGVIGKGGQRIKEIQEESNARLVATSNTLPLSGDRVLEMLGVPDAIHIATYHMLMTVKDQSDRPCHDRPYRPEYAISMTSSSSNSSSHNLSSSSNSSSSSYYGSSSNSSSSQYGSSSGSGSHHHGYESSGNTNSNHHHHHSHQPHHHNGNASSGSGHWPLETRTFHCPSDKVGPMIGKGGNRINRIRMDT